ncbi:MAG: hypothetical protein AAB316_04675, partial [Bacteroidota bacterium]
MYVNQAASGADNGTSWADAFTDVQTAINNACDIFPTPDVWVAAGTYLPYEPHGGVGDRYNTFYISCDVKIYGGFDGSEASLSERDWEANVTTLSGDIGTPGNNSDNVFHVVWIDHVSGIMTLDGFTVTGGKAEGGGTDFRGGGIYNNGAGNGGDSHPTIANCTITGNSAASGGGMFNIAENGGSASPSLANCTFTNNNGGNGGGFFNFGWNGVANPTFTTCTFSGNNAGYGSQGGAVHNYANGGGSAANPVFTNCSFLNNSINAGSGGAVFNNADEANGIANPTFDNCSFIGNGGWNGGAGGAVYNTSARNNFCFPGGVANPTFSNCLFSGNYTGNEGGAIRNYQANCAAYSNPTFTNCSFVGNYASVNGVMLNSTGFPIFKNCILWGNNSGIADNFGGSTTVTYSIVEGGYAGTGNLNADPLFVTAPGAPPSSSGDLHLQAASPAIDAGTASGAPANDLDDFPRP